MTDKKQGENQCERPSMKGFPWNVLVGAFIGIFVVQIWGAKKVETRFTMAFDLRHPDLWLYLWVAFPFMIGLTMSFSTRIVANLSRIMVSDLVT